MLKNNRLSRLLIIIFNLI